MAQVTDAYDWVGRTLIGRDGEKIGTVEEIYVDAEGGHPEWARVSTGLFGSDSCFIPLAGAAPQGENMVVRVTKAEVKDAPRPEPENELSQEEEVALYRHYGIDFTQEGSVTASEDDSIGDGMPGRVLGERAAGDSSKTLDSRSGDLDG